MLASTQVYPCDPQGRKLTVLFLLFLCFQITRCRDGHATTPRLPPLSPRSVGTSTSPDNDQFTKTLQAIQRRKVIYTFTIDFDFLSQIGVLEEFTHLTSRIGLRQEFWTIPSRYRSYDWLTKEFLASVVLVNLNERGPGIRFQLQRQAYRRSLDRVRRWFYIDLPQTKFLGYLPEDQIDDDHAPTLASLRRDF